MRPYNLSKEKILITTILLYSISSPLWSHSTLDPENWMKTLYKKLPETRLRDIIIPGTHDSGSYGINKNSPLAPQTNKLFALSKKTTSKWSKTQNLSILKQLKRGIRHIDLKVSKYKGQFSLVSGLVSVPLNDVLKDLKAWAASHPFEIVLIELNLSVQTLRDTKELHREISRHIGPFLAFPMLPPSLLTFGDLWVKERERPLILITPPSFKKLSPRYWNKDKVFHALKPNTQKKSELMNQLLYGIERSPGLYNQDWSKLYASELRLKSSPKVIATGFLKFEAPKNLSQFSRPLFETPSEAIDSWLQKDLEVNIIKVDFFEKTNLVKASLEANKETLIKGGKKWD